MAFLEYEIGVIQVEREIRSRVTKQMEKTQAEHYPNEQMKAIQMELVDGDNDAVDEAKELEGKARRMEFSPEAREKFDVELKTLGNMPPMSPEATVARHSVDSLTVVPWKSKMKAKRDT